MPPTTDIADRLDAWASKIEAMTPDLINEVVAAREATAEIRRLRVLNASMFAIGTQMSNVLYNLEQSDNQHPRDRLLMRKLTHDWDGQQSI